MSNRRGRLVISSSFDNRFREGWELPTGSLSAARQSARVPATDEPTASSPRRIAACAFSHLGPAVKGTACVLWRAIGEAGAMCLVRAPPDPHKTDGTQALSGASPRTRSVGEGKHGFLVPAIDPDSKPGLRTCKGPIQDPPRGRSALMQETE